MDFEISVVLVGLAESMASTCFFAASPRNWRSASSASDTIAESPSSSPSSMSSMLSLRLLLEAAQAIDAIVELLALALSVSAPRPHRSRATDLPPCCSTSPVVLPPDPSQRCLLSRLMACLISSTMFSNFAAHDPASSGDFSQRDGQIAVARRRCKGDGQPRAMERVRNSPLEPEVTAWFGLRRGSQYFFRRRIFRRGRR